MDRGSEVVIVALPSKDDQVHKYSSEKSPHLTLLYLGKANFNFEELVHVTDYVQHATSQMTRFGLDVTDRGELGEKRADVLFFNKKWSKNIETFRDHLLRDPLISTAYQSSEQFPDWTPHLTMGYPDSPAKKDTRDYPGISYVMFDRIALWTGDFEGTEFSLKPFDDYLEVAMSETRMGELTHYGIKGMKWGVRRSEPSGGSSSSQPTEVRRLPASADAKAAANAGSKALAGGTRSLSNQELQTLITRMNLERQYSSLTSPGIQSHQKSTLAKGIQGVDVALKVGGTVEKVRKFLETPTGKAVKTGVTTAASAGLAYATGGTSAAATAGAGALVRQVARSRE